MIFHLCLQTGVSEASSYLSDPGPQWAVVPWNYDFVIIIIIIIIITITIITITIIVFVELEVPQCSIHSDYLSSFCF